MTVKICLNDQTPLVPTFEKPGTELHCLGCGAYWPLFHHGDADATPENVRRLDQLADLFHAGRRGPIDIAALELPPAPPPNDANIKCDGCGADSGRTTEQGKPGAWYGRTIDGVTAHACSRSCAETVSEKTNTSKAILPW